MPYNLYLWSDEERDMFFNCPNDEKRQELLESLIEYTKYDLHEDYRILVGGNSQICETFINDFWRLSTFMGMKSDKCVLYDELSYFEFLSYYTQIIEKFDDPDCVFNLEIFDDNNEVTLYDRETPILGIRWVDEDRFDNPYMISCRKALQQEEKLVPKIISGDLIAGRNGYYLNMSFRSFLEDFKPSENSNLNCLSDLNYCYSFFNENLKYFSLGVNRKLGEETLFYDDGDIQWFNSYEFPPAALDVIILGTLDKTPDDVLEFTVRSKPKVFQKQITTFPSHNGYKAIDKSEDIL